MAVKSPSGTIPQTPAISVHPLRDLVHWVEQPTGAFAVSALAIDGSVGFLTARVMVPRQPPRVGGERPPSHYEQRGANGC